VRTTILNKLVWFRLVFFSNYWAHRSNHHALPIWNGRKVDAGWMKGIFLKCKLDWQSNSFVYYKLDWWKILC